MRICYLCSDSGVELSKYNGSAAHVRSVVESFVELGHEVDLLMSRTEGADELGVPHAVADAQPGQLVFQTGRVVRHRLVHAGGVAGVVTGHGRQHQRRIAGGERQHPGLIEAGSEGDHAVAGDPAEGGPKTGETASAGR